MLLLMCPALPKLIAETAPDKSTATTTDVDHRVRELEKLVLKLRAQLAALKQASAPAATVTIPAAAVQQQAVATAPAPASTSDLLSGISSQPANRSSALRLFDSVSNQFVLNVIQLGLLKTPHATSRLGTT
jgi:hypothetical protein